MHAGARDHRIPCAGSKPGHVRDGAGRGPRERHRRIPGEHGGIVPLALGLHALVALMGKLCMHVCKAAVKWAYASMQLFSWLCEDMHVHLCVEVCPARLCYDLVCGLKNMANAAQYVIVEYTSTAFAAGLLPHLRQCGGRGGDWRILQVRICTFHLRMQCSCSESCVVGMLVSCNDVTRVLTCCVVNLQLCAAPAVRALDMQPKAALFRCDAVKSLLLVLAVVSPPCTCSSLSCI